MMRKYEPIEDSGWVPWLGCCGWLVIGAGVIAALVLLASGGVLYAAAVVPAAAMSASGFMVLREVAKDTRAIRNAINRHMIASGKTEQEVKELKQMLCEKKENEDGRETYK